MKKHVCEGNWARTHRLVLSYLTWNEEAKTFLENEIGDCAKCWRAIAQTAVYRWANGLALQARSVDLASASVVQTLAEEAWPA